MRNVALLAVVVAACSSSGNGATGAKDAGVAGSAGAGAATGGGAGSGAATGGSAGAGAAGAGGSAGSVDCSTVGCAAPPLCSEGCTAACGCCACSDGEKMGELVCHGGCYETADGATSDAQDGAVGDSDAADGDAMGCAPITDAALACSGTSSSTLGSVAIRLQPAKCTVTSAEAVAGVSLPYELVVAETVHGVWPLSLDAGGCDTGPFIDVTGNGLGYCLCDTGLCAPQTPIPADLVPGCYPGTLHWEGVSWSGPSDTGNPKGAPFPPGNYTVSVRMAFGAADGGAAFSAQATMTVTITP